MRPSIPFPIRLFALLCVLLPGVLSGCGGGGGSTAPGAALNAGRGALQLTVPWPAAARSPLPDYQSVKVTLSAGGQPVADKTLTRPTGSATTSPVAFTELPAGPLSLTVQAFASRDGTGTPVATASRAVTITAGQTQQQTISRAADIASVKITAAADKLRVGEILELSAEATDSAGNIVLITNWNWGLTVLDVAALTTNGDKATITGSAVGKVTVIAKLPETDASARLDLTVYDDSPYILTDLGTIPDGKEFQPLAISADGKIVLGRFTRRNDLKGGFLWQDGKMQVAFRMFENTSGFYQAINSANEMAGWLVTGDIETDFPGVLLPAGIGFGRGEATGINDKGQAVGVIDSKSVFEPTLAVVWQSAQRQALPPLNDGLYSRAHAINNSGSVVGRSDDGVTVEMQDVAENGVVVQRPRRRRNFQLHAVLWQNGQITDLGPGSANAINDAGLVVGSDSPTIPGEALDSVTRALLWQNGQKTDLGRGAAFGINNKGQIVGTDGQSAILWQDGKAQDLNRGISGSLRWDLKSATAINDAGQIVGAGNRGGILRAFLLTPRTTGN